MKFILISIACLMSSCTYSINMVHTHGSASDVVDDTESNTPNIAPVLTIPLKP